jgi:hypothetical protein
MSTVLAPQFELRVGDRTLTPSVGDVESVSVTRSLDAAARFTATLRPQFDHGEGRFTILPADLFEPETPVTVSLGFEADTDRVFVGRVAGSRATFPAARTPTVELNGFGPTFPLTRDSASDSWTERTDSDVAADIADQYAFEAVDVEETGVTRRQVVQNGETDFRFLQALAARNGFECFADLDVFRFRAPRDDADPAVTLAYGDTLRSFTAERTRSADIAEVTVRYWNPTGKREIVGTATRDSGGEATRVLRRPVDSPEEAERVAEGELTRLARGTVRASGETVGTPAVTPGTTVAVDGIDAVAGAADRVYYVRSVTHRVDAAGYRTTFEATEAVA